VRSADGDLLSIPQLSSLYYKEDDVGRKIRATSPHSGKGNGEGNPSAPSRGYSEVLWVQYSLVYYTGEGVVLRSLVYYTGDDE